MKEVLWAECGTKLEELKLEKIGRPYGGCCIFYKKSLAGCISICSTGSKRVNAIVVQLADGKLLLIANVYFPTNDGTVSSRVNLNGTLKGCWPHSSLIICLLQVISIQISHIKLPLVRHF